ncbi:MAG: class IV adenylate cyclase [Planctomycetes bacterium]|nr:class IV adenylate cyclase [Planctomycetota bacterium]MBL7143607.1 class IV adenylate cyclase [Phycisphaerae bacterium]
MCTEIETKLKVDSLSEVEHKLGELGAKFMAEQLQTDYFFDDVNATLTKADRCLRLRKQIVEESESCFLTYKGAKEKSNLKRRQEIESEINDADSVYKLLLALGYEQVLIVEKKRCLWQLGNCEVALDRLPLLGDFVEIEGPNEEEITNVQNNLGLNGLPHISKSYASLLKERLQQPIK